MNIEVLKQKLTEEKVKLESELAALGIKDPKTGDWGAILEEEPSAELADMNDHGDRFEEFGERANTLGELEIYYRDVERALEKIEKDDGSYGVCEVSGQSIEEDRLMANPAARTCKAHMNETLD
jgi:RNA polymerase-binding transcription factor DksA